MTKSTGSALDPQTVYQEFADAQAVLEQKRQDAIAELLTQKSEINKHLEALGYDGTSTVAVTTLKVGGTGDIGSSKTRAVKGAKKKAAKSSADRFCTICGIGGHDARSHRSQGKRKKAFTQSELDSIAS